MKGKAEQKLNAKRAAWLARTSEVLGIDETAAREVLAAGRQQGVRLNPLVAPPEETLARLAALGWRGKPYSWAKDCYAIDEGAAAVRDSAAAASGAAFIQNAASWLPVVALQPQAGERILDVCAAPGGKSSHIAACTNNKAALWVNDNSRARLLKMRANLQRMGVRTENVTLYDAAHLARRLDGEAFDRILLDAPCSGEGLMDFGNDKDFATWSVAHIKRLQRLQKRIITKAWRLLKPGGTLVYSTCTMAPEENEAVIDFLLRTHRDAAVEPLSIGVPNAVPAVCAWKGKTYRPETGGCLRLAPSRDIEAFFVCRLKKLAADGQYVL